MSATPPRRYQFRREQRREFRYHLSISVAVLLSWFVYLLPRPVRGWIANRAGDLFHWSSDTYRANVLANLEQALPDTPAEELKRLTRSIFRTSARNFADLLLIPRLGRTALLRGIELPEGDWTTLADALRPGNGVVIVSAHVGAFDYIGQSLASKGYAMTTVTGRTTSRFVFDGVTYLRGSKGNTMVEPTPSGVRRVVQALRRGELAAFVVDYDYFQNGKPVEFFGRATTLPPGPIRIARETGAPIMPIFAHRTATGHALSIHQPFHVKKTNDIDQDVADGLARLIPYFERTILAMPGQWVMFQRVWPEAPADPVRVFPVGSPLESELLERVAAALPERRSAPGGADAAAPDPAAEPRDRTDQPRRFQG